MPVRSRVWDFARVPHERLGGKLIVMSATTLLFRPTGEKEL